MPNFMVILQGPPGPYDDLSPEEREQVFNKYRAWGDRMRAADRAVGGAKLKDEGGKIVSARQGRMSVVDGPYSEAKEVLGGYMTIRASNYEEALELVRDHPHLQIGTIALREVDPMGCGKGE